VLRIILKTTSDCTGKYPFLPMSIGVQVQGRVVLGVNNAAFARFGLSEARAMDAIVSSISSDTAVAEA
jgi:hypothetical protein